jgi:hypothetical protein
MRIMQHCMAVSWQLSGYAPTEEQVREHLTSAAALNDIPDEWRAITHGNNYGFYGGGVFVRYGSLLP